MSLAGAWSARAARSMSFSRRRARLRRCLVKVPGHPLRLRPATWFTTPCVESGSGVRRVLPVQTEWRSAGSIVFGSGRIGRGIDAVFASQTASLHASCPHSVTLMQLRFASLAVINSWRDLPPQECARAGRTKKKPGVRPASWVSGGDRPITGRNAPSRS